MMSSEPGILADPWPFMATSCARAANDALQGRYTRPL